VRNSPTVTLRQEACYYSTICVFLFAVDDSINLKRDFHFITLQHHLILDRNYLSLASHRGYPSTSLCVRRDLRDTERNGDMELVMEVYYVQHNDECCSFGPLDT
jgi:hypothetical protein